MFWILGLLGGEPALANGQSTHVWITLHAMEHLDEGPLRDFVTHEEVQQALINGTMFPDGGYAIDDGYGEIAHWEPFQNRYRDWIAQTHSPPWSDEARPHLAFLLGMASHGIADQVFDALFMERSRQEDAAPRWADNFDLSTDVVMMERVGPMTAPAHWVPSQTLIEIYQTDFDHPISEDDLERAQALLRLAIGSVGLWSEDPDTVADHEARFPWAAAHLDDPDQPGSPPCEGRVLARYWQSVWDRLHGDADFDPAVIWTFPEDGSYGHPTDASLVQTRIGLVFAEAIVADSLTDAHIVLAGEDGTVVPTTAWLFYRNHSHVVLVRPLENLAEDAAYTLTVQAGIETIDGRVTSGGESIWFSTAPPPVVDSGRSDTGATRKTAGCGCAVGLGDFRASGGLLLLVALAAGRRRYPGYFTSHSAAASNCLPYGPSQARAFARTRFASAIGGPLRCAATLRCLDTSSTASPRKNPPRWRTSSPRDEAL